MMLGMLGVLNTFPTNEIFNLQMHLLRHNPFINHGRSVLNFEGLQLYACIFKVKQNKIFTQRSLLPVCIPV